MADKLGAKQSEKARIHDTGMTCASCVARVEQALASVPGVISANVNLASEKATVEYIEGTEFSELRRAVADAGYELGSEITGLTKGGVIMAIDPVCKMEVAESQAAATSEYKGKKYYFCAVGCKKAFDQNPEKYLAEEKK